VSSVSSPLDHAGKARDKHPGQRGGVLDVLRSHPFIGLSLTRTPRCVVLHCADTPPRHGRVQSHVGGVESLDGVVEVFRGGPAITLEVRNPGTQQECDRIGPWPSLSGDAARRGASNGEVSARVPVAGGHREGAAPALPFEPFAISLEPSDRAVLHQRIATRFHAMIEAGLLAELEGLRARHALHAALPSMRAVGYRQAWETLEGVEPRDTLAARGIAATRQLAKRQLTWLRSMERLERYDCLRPDLEGSVAKAVEDFLSRPRGT